MDADPNNRDLILGKALALFSDRGYEAVGVAEICEAAAVTKPTLYHYYGSKRGLLDAILEERGGRLYAALRASASYAAGDRAKGVPEGLGRMARALAEDARADPAFARLRLGLAFAPPSSEGGQAYAPLNDRLFALAQAFFEAAAGDHGNMRGRARPYAAAFLGTVDTYIGLFLTGRSRLSDAEIEGALRQFMFGIFS